MKMKCDSEVRNTIIGKWQGKYEVNQEIIEWKYLDEYHLVALQYSLWLMTVVAVFSIVEVVNMVTDMQLWRRYLRYGARVLSNRA